MGPLDSPQLKLAHFFPNSVSIKIFDKELLSHPPRIRRLNLITRTVINLQQILKYIQKLFHIDIIKKSVAKRTLVLAAASEGGISGLPRPHTDVHTHTQIFKP